MSGIAVCFFEPLGLLGIRDFGNLRDFARLAGPLNIRMSYVRTRRNHEVWKNRKDSQGSKRLRRRVASPPAPGSQSSALLADRPLPFDPETLKYLKPKGMQ